MKHGNPMKKAVSAAAALSLTALLAACSTGEASEPTTSSAAETDASDLTVALVTPESTGEYYGAMYCGAQAAADEFGITLNIQGTPETTVEAEMQVLQSVLATEPDGLSLTVWDNTAFNEIVGEYTDAGHPLVMPDSYLTNDEFLQSVRTDGYQSSYDAALATIEEFGIESGSALVLTDAPGNAFQLARAEGFRDAIIENTDLEMLEFQYIGGDAAEASQATSSAIAANGDLALVFSTNIGAGTGAANGIDTSDSEAILLGYDTSAAQVDSLRNGEYDALVGQSPYLMGYTAISTISEVLLGETAAEDVTEQVVWAPWALVTAENVDTPEISEYLYTTDCAAIG
ncbi:substrate-binding domain-containing protein [Demequina zhanjiangensis]|uniref:Substrate-binding domain-containing protein n=1 Tax=Demequina zhanjiangensis TaxID=3051659 RepID=A0ABT8G0H1_9MICO|nr:substrate-binding domain-containing protein [Demequina sp. SYSU T00b26]MDN4472607.1 substrate-binding domain-containing protein [Demequina sp. SYSU T00b26]